MMQFLAAIAEFLGLAAFAAAAQNQRAAQPVSTVVAALVALLVGATIGAPVASALPALPAFVSISLALVALVIFLVVLKAFGVPFGSSSSWRASLFYALAFFLGAFGLLALFGS